MNDTQRHAIAMLSEIWSLSPEVRLGQLMAHLGFLGEASFDRSLGYLDDQELIAEMIRHRGELLARLPNSLETPDDSRASDIHATCSVCNAPIRRGGIVVSILRNVERLETADNLIHTEASETLASLCGECGRERPGEAIRMTFARPANS